MNHFIEALERSIKDRNWYSVLFISLTLPDICGKVEYPNKGSKARTVLWFDRYLGSINKSVIGGKEYVFLGGSDFYALRCALLHEGKSDITSQSAKEILERFTFSQPVAGNNRIHRILMNNTLRLQVDQFGLEVLDAVNSWMRDIEKDKEKISKINSMLKIEMLDFSKGFSI